MLFASEREQGPGVFKKEVCVCVSVCVCVCLPLLFSSSRHFLVSPWPVPVQGAVTEKVKPQAWLQYPKACPGRMGMSSQETCETSETLWEVRTWQEPWEEPVPVCPCHDISERGKKIHLSFRMFLGAQYVTVLC